jgi:hypothetical protein
MRKLLLAVVGLSLFVGCTPKDNPQVAPPLAPVAESPRKVIEQAEMEMVTIRKSSTDAIPVANRIVEKGTAPSSKDAILVRDTLVQSTSALDRALTSLAIAKDRSDSLTKERDQYLKQWQGASKEAQKERERNAVLQAEKTKAIKQRNILFLILCVIVGGAVLFFVLKATGRTYRIPFL